MTSTPITYLLHIYDISISHNILVIADVDPVSYVIYMYLLLESHALARVLVVKPPPVHFSLTQVRNAFSVMDLQAEQIMEIMSVLSAILHLGNISFVSAAGAQISTQASLDTVSTLLGLDSFRLGDALTKKFMVLRGEEITTPLTKEQVCACMHACVAVTGTCLITNTVRTSLGSFK